MKLTDRSKNGCGIVGTCNSDREGEKCEEGRGDVGRL